MAENVVRHRAYAGSDVVYELKTYRRVGAHCLPDLRKTKIDGVSFGRCDVPVHAMRVDQLPECRDLERLARKNENGVYIEADSRRGDLKLDLFIAG